MTDKENDSGLLPDKMLSSDMRQAALGGGLAAAVIIGAVYLSGQVTGAEARQMLEAILPSVRFLASAVMTVTATILTLMLTLLSISYSLDMKLKKGFYQRIRWAGVATTWAFCAAVLILLFVSVPIMESDKVPNYWYIGIYYVVLISSALLGGALISVAFMLYHTIRNLVEIGNPEADHSHLLREQVEDD